MEHPRSREEKRINFLDESLRVTFTIEEEAVRYLPEVTPEDLETRKEKYRILLGNVLYADGKAQILIKGILEMTRDEPGYYNEEVEEVSNINISALKKYAAELQKRYHEYKEFGFIGEMHTHPVMPKGNFIPEVPSQFDIQSITNAYEDSRLKPNEPFIFAIAAPDRKGKTIYAFYRLVKRGKEYIVKEVE